MGSSFRRSHSYTAALSGPNPAAGHCQAMPPQETPGHSVRALPVVTIVHSSPAFATPLWRAECLGQENGVRENWVVYIFQQGRKHTFFILLLQTCVPHRWWEQEAHTWGPGRQGVWAGASFSCCSRGNSAWCSELVQMGPRAALLLSRNMASGMWILCSSASQT